MNKKYLIALIVLIVTAQSTRVAVGDSQQFVKGTFYNFIAVPGVIAGQTITFNYQFNFAPGSIKVSFYKQGGTKANDVTCDATPTTCVKTWGSTVTASSGDYWLELEFSSTTPLASKKVTVGSLTVTGSAATRTNSTILKQTAVVAAYRLHQVYFSTATTIKITLPYINSTQSGYYSKTSDPSSVKFFSETATTGALVSITQDATPVVDAATSTVTWSFSAPANYSWIAIDPTAFTSIDWTAPGASFTYRLNYFTDVFTCPYNADYPDTTGIYRGCIVQADLSRLPCVLYDTLLGVCKACYTGYALNNGKCVQQDCPTGQYKRYGQCLPNPQGCDTFNEFTKCTKCSTGFALANGVCARAPLTCTGRTFFNSATWTCDKVDDKCKEWAAQTGACSACVSAVEKVVAGKCIPAEQTCNEKQYVNAVLACVDADPLCQIFEKWGGKCIKCVWGYDYNATQAKCIKIVCPNRFVPNDYAKCVRVSDLCESFDARGVCLNCIPTHALQSNGVCLQIQKPEPCPDRQYLGDDNFCHEISELCEIYNKESGDCTKCVNNYFLMYTGECVLQRQCKSRQVLINNDCHDVSPTCGNYDRTTGKCLNCASEDYELYYGLCIPVSNCGVRQWTDNNGNCFDVSTKCNTFNPSTGDCTSCVQGYNYLNGICCLRGQFNSNGQCVDAKDASEVSNTNGCRTYVNGIGCVRCDEGFVRAQDNFGFYNCKSL